MTTLPFETADLKNRATIEDMVRIYNSEVENIRRAYQTLESAARNLTDAFGKESNYSGIDTIPNRYHDAERTTREVLDSIKVSCWKHLIECLGVRKIISLKRGEELDKKLNDPRQLPEITVQNVFEAFDLLVGSAADFAKEAVREVYEAFHVRRLNSGSSDWERRHTLKTNQRNATEDLGRKIIVLGVVHTEYGGGYRTEYGRYGTDKLRALDKVFHILDGQPFNEAGYLSPLLDAIHSSGSAGVGETPYFKFKCYGNGNLHLEFKRLDLLKEFNRIANDGTQLKNGEII